MHATTTATTSTVTIRSWLTFFFLLPGTVKSVVIKCRKKSFKHKFKVPLSFLNNQGNRATVK